MSIILKTRYYITAWPQPINTDTEQKKHEILKIQNPKIRKNTEILNKKIQILNIFLKDSSFQNLKSMIAL